ncbi:MAG: TonB-dependent receptor [Bryobacter sp.]|nr:TonB-dependent receptor [Bryobacter sp.]
MSAPFAFRLTLALVLIAASAAGQSTFATLTGTVTDPTGAPVPGASVEVVNIGTGYKYDVKSNDVGQYVVPNLLEGRYRLKATAAGFQEFSVTEIVLAARDLRRVDVGFQIGQVATAIEVTGGVTLIETETARVADTRIRQTMVDMPLSLRRAWDFIQLSPNVSKTKSGFNMRFGGSRTRQGDVTVDGVSITNVFGGQITGVVSDRTESYQEIRLEVAGSGAENPGIGQMSVVTRSGTNELHGEAFNYYTSPGLSARNPFSTVGTGVVEWVPGGSIGGPVYIPKVYDGRNKSFFFASLEFERFGSPGRTTLNTNVPIADWRRGDFSRLLPGTVVRDPNANAPFPGNVIPTSRLNPAAVKLQERFFPLPNFGDPNVFVAQNNREVLFNERLVQPTSVIRGDHRFSDKIFTNARWTRVRWPQNNWVGSLPTIGQTDRMRKNNGISFAYTHTISPSWLSEFRYGLATDAFPETPPLRGLDIVNELKFQGLAPNLPDVGGSPTIGFTNLGLTGISNNVQCDPCIEYIKHNFQENVSWLSSRHSVKMGIQIDRGSYTDFRQGAGLFGNNTFSNRFTNHTYADFLLGIPTTMVRNFPALKQQTQSWTYGIFVQDEFRFRPNLTLNFGLRYDLKPGFTATDGLQSVFDIGTGKIVIPDGALSKVSPLMPKGYVDVVEASSVGFSPSRLLRADKNNFSPRVGFAWRPWGNDTVFRGGFGFYYDVTAKNAALSTVPFNIAEPAYTNPTDRPLVWPVVFPATSTGGPSTVSIPGAMNPDLRIPYSMQYNFTIERQQWDTGFRLSYIGTNTRQGVWGYNVNQPLADTRLFADKPRRFQNYPAINYVTNGAGHQYHAMTVEIDRPLKGGLRAQAYYTWARDIGDLEDGEQPEDAYNRTRERAVWTDIPTHRFSTNWLYQLPMGKGKPYLANTSGWVSALVTGYQFGVVYVYETGNFLTPTWTGPDPTGTRFTPNRTPANVTLRPDVLRNPNLSDPTISRWFDGTAFRAPAAGQFGASSKGLVIGPGTNVFHMNFAKVTPIKERFKLRTEVVATNALNKANYLDPALNITDTGAVGIITGVVNRNSKMDMAIPRVIQLVLRLQW